MSRRKQSNPKPLKRKSDDVLEAVSQLHHLPTDLLTLKDPEDETQEYTVYTKGALKEGFIFGPYSGALVPNDDRGRHSPLHIIQAQDLKGIKCRLGLHDDAGWWLKLLRPANSRDSSNISITLEGSDVWCTVSSTIDADTELFFNFEIINELVSKSSRSSVEPDENKNFTVIKRINQMSPKSYSVKDLERWQRRSPSSGKELIRSSVIANESENESMDAKDLTNGSPHSNEGTLHNETLSDSGMKYEASSPLSPPCATSPPPELQPCTTQSATVTGSSSSYSNGYCNNYSVFPYGTSPECSNDGPYQCSVCQVKFASPRTLQVHQLYYCTHRHSSMMTTSDTDSEDANSSVKADPASHHPEIQDVQEHIERERKRMKKCLVPTGRSGYETSSKRSSITSGSTNAGSSRIFRCPYCRYSSDKKASLTRHVRMHGNSGLSSDQQTELPLCTPPVARYCSNCDIQFASFKNYQVHKQFYCSTRHVHKSFGTRSSSPSQQATSARRASPEKTSTTTSQDTTSNPYNMMMNQPLYAAISTSPLILVPCSYVAGGGLSPAAGLIPAGNIIIPNGPSSSSPENETNSQGPNVIPTYTVVSGANTSTLTENSPEDKLSTSDSVGRKHDSKSDSFEKDESSLQAKRSSPDVKPARKEDSEKPLDLSFRKSEQSNEDAKHNNSNNTTSMNSSSLPTAAISSTSSTCSDEGPPISLPHYPAGHLPLDRNLHVTETHPPIVSELRTTSSTKNHLISSPQVLVKHGTSKCKECNIVFYKHENYLVHKNLYCASRLRSNQSASPDSGRTIDEEMPESEALGSPEKSRMSSPIVTFPKTPEPSDSSTEQQSRSPTNPALVLQFYCMACGIKFTSLDNLTAHQTYYCPKRELVSNQPVGVVPTVSRGDFRCNKCKNSYPTEELLKQHPCPVQRKCPYCDVYCPTLSATQRHLVTHTGVRSFRCSLCGYKGHTLRGMRTHIRIHLDKNNTTPEEAYILCVDEGGTEIGSINRKQGRNSTDRSFQAPEQNYNDSVTGGLAPSGASALLSADVPIRKVIPDIVSDQVVSGDITHWCQICGYSSSYKGNVVRHVKLVHKELMATQSMASIVNSRPNASLPECKQPEILDVQEENAPKEVITSKPIVNGTSVKPEQTPKIKQDESEPVVIKSESLSPPPVTESGKGLKRSLSVDVQNPGSTTALVNSKAGPKYCKYCDISFNYLANFIAHKKFYCTPRPTEIPAQDSGSVQSVQ